MATNQQQKIILEDCECCKGTPILSNLISHEMDSDTDYTRDSDMEISDLYNDSDTNTRKVIDKIFITLTGWSMSTLLFTVGKPVDKAHNIDFEALYKNSLKDRRAVESHLFKVEEELKDSKVKVRSLEDELETIEECYNCKDNFTTSEICDSTWGSCHGYYYCRMCWTDHEDKCNRKDCPFNLAESSDSDDSDDSDEECEICGRVTDQTTPPCSVCEATMCDRCGHFQFGYDPEEDPNDENSPWYCPTHFPKE